MLDRRGEQLKTTFRIVDTSEVGRAHAWHSGFAAANDAIFPRTAQAFYDLTLDRNVWCAITDDDEIVGMSYAKMDDRETEVEIGGLMVSAKTRGRGIGDLMMRLPLVHFLVSERPLRWECPPKIVAHALEGNEMPRRIIARAGFEFHEEVSIPPEALPGLRVGADGMVHGDEFHLKLPDALYHLAAWLDGWDDSLRDGSPAAIKLLEDETLADWANVLRSMA